MSDMQSLHRVSLDIIVAQSWLVARNALKLSKNEGSHAKSELISRRGLHHALEVDDDLGENNMEPHLTRIPFAPSFINVLHQKLHLRG